jgi:hypothetical protein
LKVNVTQGKSLLMPNWVCSLTGVLAFYVVAACGKTGFSKTSAISKTNLSRLQRILVHERRRRAAIVIGAFAALAGCASSEPVPAPPPSTFERSWGAALAAAQDEGVRITSEDRINGVIRGYKDRQEVTINIRTQADGNVRVEMSARGPKGSDPGLAGRISRAYDRRMGR